MAREYRLLTYRSRGGISNAGVLIGDRVFPASSLVKEPDVDTRSVLGMLQTWERTHDALIRAVENPPREGGMPLADTLLEAPIQYPGAVFCAGQNYWDHAHEMAEAVRRRTGKAPPVGKTAEPWFFVKTGVHSIIGPNTPIRLPPLSKQVDWEAEAAVVIGRPARNVPLEKAFDYVAGYLIVNDVSARDLMQRADRAGTGFAADWMSHKCFDDSAPMGPWLTPAAFVPDPNHMSIKLWVNDVVKQDSDTSQLIHGIAEQITFLSKRLTLRPGDVIATGTPAGVGAGRGEFLQSGDRVRIELGSCGTLENPVIDYEASSDGAHGS